MSIDRKIVHELKNQLAISIGLIELAHKAASKEESKIEINKIIDRLERSLIAQRKIQDILESNFEKEKPTN